MGKLLINNIKKKQLLLLLKFLYYTIKLNMKKLIK